MIPQGGHTVKIRNLAEEDKFLVDTLHNKATRDVDCRKEHCFGSRMYPDYLSVLNTPRSKEQILKEAKEFLTEYYADQKLAGSPEHNARWEEIRSAVEETNTYDLTFEELDFGARMAWRNAPRCIGRRYWKRLQLFDGRNVKTAREMFEIMCKQLDYATNDGALRSAITIFPKRVEGRGDFRVWNNQILQYAGHKMEDGTIIADPINVDLTKQIEKLGYKFKKTAFEILPWVLQANGEDPEIFDIPKELVLEIPITHPKYDVFEKMGLKWYAVPGVSSMSLDCGGIQFPGTPFNGWYMTTEIAIRDLCDKQRLDLLDKLAEGMGFDIKTSPAFWKDRAMCEISYAVLNSFKEHGTTIVDHYTVTEQFMEHFETEFKLRGGCPGDWVWLVPPISGSLCPVFHQEMISYKLKPCLDYQPPPWLDPNYRKRLLAKSKVTKKFRFKSVARSVMPTMSFFKKYYEAREKCTIIYATETGRSTKFAEKLSNLFLKVFNVQLVGSDDYSVSSLPNETLVFIVASTFGDGEPPGNGENFYESLKDYIDGRESGKIAVDKTKKPFLFGVFALGSTNYPHYCEFGHILDNLMPQVGGSRILECGEGNEVKGQEQSFNRWANKAFQEAVKVFYPTTPIEMPDDSDFISSTKWNSSESRAIRSEKVELSVWEGVSHISAVPVYEAFLSDRVQLQSETSDRKTMLATIDRSAFVNELQFEAGDHLAVFPRNRVEDVEAVLGWVDTKEFSLDTVIEMQTMVDSEWSINNRLPACSVRFALQYLLDLCQAPHQDFLTDLSQFATDKSEQAELEELSKDVDKYEEWKAFNAPNVAFLAKKYPTARPTVEMIMDCLPLIIPRYYSISSSPNAFPTEIHLTVAVENYLSNDGIMHSGMCSSWLDEIPIGEVIQCFTKKAAGFRMPADPKVPVIMIGPGTGIAPFRSFWQERLLQQEAGELTKDTQMDLYFGCRSRKTDHIFEGELSKLLYRGILSNLHLALSREPGEPKVYVQELIRKNWKSLYNQLVELNGHLYVCGGVNMAADVKKVLNMVFENERGKYESFTALLKKQKRFHEDIFGATSGKLIAGAK